MVKPDYILEFPMLLQIFILFWLFYLIIVCNKYVYVDTCIKQIIALIPYRNCLIELFYTLLYIVFYGSYSNQIVFHFQSNTIHLI